MSGYLPHQPTRQNRVLAVQERAACVTARLEKNLRFVMITIQHTSCQIRTSKVRLKVYGGTPISSLGIVNLECEVNGCRHNAELHVFPFIARSILGLDSLMKLNLVNLIVAVHQVTENSPKTFHPPLHQTPNHQLQKGHLAGESERDHREKI